MRVLFISQVFLHLERDEETDGTMDNLSKKMVRNRALSRSLSLQSKSTSYQSLQNEGAVITTTTGDVPGKGSGRFHALDVSRDGLEKFDGTTPFSNTVVMCLPAFTILTG